LKTEVMLLIMLRNITIKV